MAEDSHKPCLRCAQLGIKNCNKQQVKPSDCEPCRMKKAISGRRFQCQENARKAAEGTNANHDATANPPPGQTSAVGNSYPTTQPPSQPQLQQQAAYDQSKRERSAYDEGLKAGMNFALGSQAWKKALDDDEYQLSYLLVQELFDVRREQAEEERAYKRRMAELESQLDDVHRDGPGRSDDYDRARVHPGHYRSSDRSRSRSPRRHRERRHRSRSPDDTAARPSHRYGRRSRRGEW